MAILDENATIVWTISCCWSKSGTSNAIYRKCHV